MNALITPAGIVYDGATVPALCLDLDGTVRYSRSGAEFIASPDDVSLFDGAEAVLWEYRRKGWLILGLSNQGGVAYGFKSPFDADAELTATLAAFERNPFHIAKMCFHHPAGTTFPYNRRSLLRKPDYGMLALMEVEAFGEGYLIDWDASLFVGDRREDEECAKRAGIAFRWAHEFFGRDGGGP